MKTFYILFAVALSFAQPCFGQTALPEVSPPAADAPMQERIDWCDAYVHWLYAGVDTTPAAEDVRETQHIEDELNGCKLNPAGYQHDTIVEAVARLNRASLERTQ